MPVNPCYSQIEDRIEVTTMGVSEDRVAAVPPHHDDLREDCGKVHRKLPWVTGLHDSSVMIFSSIPIPLSIIIALHYIKVLKGGDSRRGRG